MDQVIIQDIQIGSQIVGPNHPPLILPDIDMFFNGDLAVAERLIACVKAAGLTTIKAAILEDPEVVLDNGAEEEFLRKDGTIGLANYRQLIHKKILTRKQHQDLFATVHKVGLELVVSVYDTAGVDLAVAEGAVAIKIPSSNITFRVLIESAARTGLPLIMDTGKATMPEITRAVAWAKLAGAGNNIIVEHSPMAPPAPTRRQDLSLMPYLRNTLGLNVGLSHHARGPLMILASVPLGVTLIEFGFCRDNEDDDQDVFHALQESELAPTVQDVLEIYEALGDPYDLSRHAITFHQARMGLRARVDIPEGAQISLENIAFSFPPIGIGAEEWNEVEGMTTTKALMAGSPICRLDVA